MMAAQQSPTDGSPAASRPRAGITLIEMMVIIGIIGVLLGLSLSARQAVCVRGCRMQCQSKLRQIGLALAQYTNAHDVYPVGRPSRLIAGDDTSFGPSVFVNVLGYMDEVDCYNEYNFSTPPAAASNLTISQIRLNLLVCPEDLDLGGVSGPANALTSYGFLYGTVGYAWEARPDPRFDPHGQINGMFNDRQSITRADLADGSAHTVLAGERALSHINKGRANPIGRWTSSLGADTLLFGTESPNAASKTMTADGRQLAQRLASVSSVHPGGAYVLMADGSVRFVKETIGSWAVDPGSGRPVGSVDVGDGLGKLPSPGVWQALITRSGGERNWPTSKDGDFD